MASIINATTSTGLVSSADNSGSLQLATNNGTTAVTIDTSQNVGIGTTSPTVPLSVLSSGQVISNFAHASTSTDANNGGAILRVQNTSNTNGNMESVIFANSNASATSGIFGYNAVQSTNEGFMTFGTRNSGGTFGERMRIASDGNVGIGTNNPSNHRLSVEQTATSGNVVRAVASSGSYSDIISEIQAARNTTNTSFRAIRYYNTGAGETKFEVLDSGTVNNRTGSYGTLSDVKLKENIVDATPKLDKVMQLQVKNYNLIGSDLKQIGFVAQEFEQVFPSMVEETSDIDGEGNNLGTTTKSIKTTVLVPILVKAIQELNTDLANTKLLLTEVSNKVEAQAVRIAELEGAK